MKTRLHQLDPGGVVDGAYTVEVAGGLVVGLTPVPAQPQYVPLTTTIGGAPEMVWDGNDEIVLTEVSL